MNLIKEKLRLAEMSVNEVIETLQDRGEGVQLKASEMLRQQQAEIEALKAKLAYMFEQEINSVAFEMVNKAILRKANKK